MTKRKKTIGKSKLSVQNSGYSHHGASRTNPTTAGWYVSSKSPSEDISANLELLRTRSRDLYALSLIHI